MSLEYLDQFPSVASAITAEGGYQTVPCTPPEVPRRVAMSGTITALRDEVHALKEERDQLLKYREVYRDRLHVAEGKVYDLEYAVMHEKMRASSCEARATRAESRNARAIRARAESEDRVKGMKITLHVAMTAMLLLGFLLGAVLA